MRFLSLLLLWTAPRALAEDLVVRGEAPRQSAGERTLLGEDLARLPGEEVEELLRVLPGMHVSSHGGQGKAPQFLLRGFDAAHGADFAGSVEGVPLNLSSHPHGHGYLDLHIVPPALVRSMSLRPGPFRLDAGDHAVAGSVDLGLGLMDEGLRGEGRLGSDRSGGAALAWRPPRGQAGDFALVEFDAGAGQGERRWFEQARAGIGLQRGGLRAWALALNGRHASPGVLLAEDIRSGLSEPTDAWPVVGGGRTQRVLAAGQGQARTNRVRGDGLLWAGAHRVDIDQNTTGWRRDPVHGDGVRQAYQGEAAGARLQGRVHGGHAEAKAGVEARWQQSRASQVAIDGQGVPLVDVEPLEQGSWELASFMGVGIQPWAGVRATSGLRAARIGLWQEAHEPGAATVLAPRLGLHLGEGLQGFVNYAQGYRSPEVQGLSDAARAPVTRVDALELGLLHDEAGRPFSARLIAFGARLDREILFDHLSARFVAGAPSRRLGLESAASLRGKGGSVELQLVGVDARFVADSGLSEGEPVPYAPRTMGALLGHAAPEILDGAEVHGRLWALGPRPLPDGFRAGARAGLDLGLSFEGPRWALCLDGENLLPGPVVEGEFVYASRPSPEEPASELPRLHWTLGAARVLRVSFSWRFA